MPDTTVAARPDHGFTRADLTTFCRLDELGLEVTGQRLAPDRAVGGFPLIVDTGCHAAMVSVVDRCSTRRP
jgi:hypothetical protein